MYLHIFRVLIARQITSKKTDTLISTPPVEEPGKTQVSMPSITNKHALTENVWTGSLTLIMETILEAPPLKDLVLEEMDLPITEQSIVGREMGVTVPIMNKRVPELYIIPSQRAHLADLVNDW